MSEATSREGTRRTAGARDLEKRSIDTIRTPAIDAVEKANSGHAGTPMGIAPPSIKARVTVEAGSLVGWDRYPGLEGTIVGMHSFAESAPGPEVMRKFGFVADKVLQAAKDQIAKHSTDKHTNETAGKPRQ